MTTTGVVAAADTCTPTVTMGADITAMDDNGTDAFIACAANACTVK